MKIAILSPSEQHLQQVCRQLQALGHEALPHPGGKSRMGEVAQMHRPDLMLVDGMCRDLAELRHVEQVTTEHPALAVILLCATPAPDFLLHAMRAGVREVLPSPAAPGELQEAVARVASRLEGRTASRDGKVLAFLPCKGGSGATFLATNLGWELARTRQVLLIDLNLQFGDALSFLHDGKPPATLADVAKDIGRLDASLLAASTVKVASGYSVLAAPEDLAHAMEIRPEQVDAIVAQATSQYDFVVLDMGRALDPLAIKALDRAWRIYAVMQSSVPDLRHATKLVQAFRSLDYPAGKVEIIINRFGKAAEIGVQQVERTLPGTRVRTVPNAWREVSASIDHGEPLVQADRNNPVARYLAELGQALCPRTDAPRGLVDRLFRRAR